MKIKTEDKRKNKIKIKLWEPHVGKTQINSFEHFSSILEHEYPCLKKYQLFSILLKQAEAHLILIKKFRQQTFLRKGDIKKISDELGQKRSLISKFITKAGRPRLYFWIERCISKTELFERLKEIQESNNKICNIDELKIRLNTYYLSEILEKGKNHLSRIKQCKRYFLALHLLKKGGGCYSAVEKR